jgi:hypothetical protein
MPSHRESYPEQYSHPLVGKRVRVAGIEGKVERVLNTRFGLLAKIEGSAPKMAYSVGKLERI